MSRIHSVKATAINVPMVAPYRYSFGSLASFTTTIVEVEDDDGVVGIGETPHGDLAGVVESLGARLTGLAPEELNACEAACLDRTGYSPWTDAARDRRAFGGIEIALWDLRARRAGAPLVDLMGGRVRDEVPFTEYFAFRDGKEETPADVIAYCTALAEQGVPWFEGKVGVVDEHTELEMIAELVSQVGAERVVRLDANGAFTVATARRVCRRLAELGIGWLEDPCRTLDETARLRQDGVPVSFSTHEVDLPRAARTGVPDGICADIAELGGIRRAQDFLRACDALGIDFWCYSGDAGVMTAAYLHLTGSEPSMIRPHQALFRFTADVVVEQGHFRPTAGVLPVPTEPGLGVTLDRDALRRLAERYRSEGAIASGRPDERMGAAYRRR
ncbi:MAG: glucarate dehydratase [Gaiellales bacterium]|jgi:glucarate dehydratase|nr:glucarate dehydratase [Gaiellales bacterium]